MRGRLIVIEGTDGCGKETQSRLLVKELKKRGIDATRIAFPQYDSEASIPLKMFLNGDMGKRKDYSPMEISMLYSIDRSVACRRLDFEEMLDKGIWIICDRYTESNMIYQCTGLSKDERDFIAAKIDYLEHDMLRIPRADKVLFLAVHPDVTQKLIELRGEMQDINEKDTDFMKKVYKTGLKLANKRKWKVIDCNTEDHNIKSIDEIQEMIHKSLNEYLNLREVK